MAVPARRTTSPAVFRNAASSTLIGIAILFLMFVGRQQFWSWRLALFGGLGGLLAYAFSHGLDHTVGDRIRRRDIVPANLVGVPLYLVAGCIAVLLATTILKALDLMPFDFGPQDYKIGLGVAGTISIVVGLLFYSSHVLRERLRESVERIKEQEFAEKELEIARAIQRRLLPPAEIEGDGYRVTARNLPARYVAGDFYDVFRLADGSLGLVVADVSGKGVGASLIMASAKAVLPLIAEGKSAAAALQELNRKLFAELASREFVALAFARFSPASGRLELGNAGLPDPYVLRPNKAPETLSVPGSRLPLGARDRVVYESLSTTLAPGDRVLFVTDGLPEALLPSGEPLGYERFAGMLSSTDAEPSAWLDRLLSDVREATSAVLDDDWTALLLEARPAERR